MIAHMAHALDLKKYNLVQIFENDLVVFDIKYATTDNFVGKVLYVDADVYLQKDAYDLFIKATKRLEKYNKEHGENYKLKIFDTLRPYDVQVSMYNLVKNTPQHIYVSSPDKGEAAHTRGIAIDLTIVDKNNTELDMGTEFDNFTEKAHRDAFERGLITQLQEKNRQLLNYIMGNEFVGYSKEWWHYNLEMTEENKVKYPKIKLSFVENLSTLHGKQST